MAPSCWFFGAWWLLLMLTATAADQHVEGCYSSGKRCGNFTISSPFWLIDMETGRSCGSPEFQIACRDNTPVVPSSIRYSRGFTITDISYEEESLRVVDLGKIRLLEASNSCNEHFWNTSDKLGIPFKIDPVNLSLVMYNCTASV